MEVITDLQRARLMAVLRGMAKSHDPGDTDALMLIGFAVGLEMAARHPEAAASLLVHLEPPIDIIDHWLQWVVLGSDQVDPEMPIN